MSLIKAKNKFRKLLTTTLVRMVFIENAEMLDCLEISADFTNKAASDIINFASKNFLRRKVNEGKQ